MCIRSARGFQMARDGRLREERQRVIDDPANYFDISSDSDEESKTDSEEGEPKQKKQKCQ